MLVAGVACTALRAGLSQFVMIWLIGLALFFVAFGLLLWDGINARRATTLPRGRRMVGVALHGTGAMLLLAVAGYASSLAYNQAMSSRPAWAAPSVHQWFTRVLYSLVPALTIMLGLRYGAQWSWRRCSFWGDAALVVNHPEFETPASRMETNHRMKISIHQWLPKKSRHRTHRFG